jgi:capsular polysaccharide biosynthesis protein
MPVEQTPTETGNTSSRANLLRALLRRLWLIVLVAVVLVGSAVGFSLTQAPTYEASIKVLVGQKDADETPGSLSGDVQGLQDLAPTMAAAVTTRPVAQAVVEQLGMPEESAGALLGNLSAQQQPDTTFIDVSYRDSDPKRAQLVVNTVGQVFSRQVSGISPNAGGVTATVWEQATIPQSPVSPNPARNGIVALALGILLGAGLALLLEHLDDSWDSPEEAERISGVINLGAIPRFEVVAREKAEGSMVQKVED